MIGWRARLGILVPSANIVLEPEIYGMLPQGVTAHFARIPITEDSPEELKGMIDYVPRASREIAHALVDVFAFGCTSGSLVEGMGYDRRIIAAIREATGKPATTTATACLQAFQSYGVARIALVTPYEEWLTQAEADFFAANGVAVIAAKGLGTRDPEEIAGVDPGRIYRLAREVDRPEAEAIFISCTDFQAVATINALEVDLGKPVFTSNQVTLWALLNLAGVQVPVPGYGRLLADLGSREGEDLKA